MSVSIVLPGADFRANPIGLMMPVTDGLEYIGIYGVDEAKTSRNLAPKKPKGSVFGVPEYFSNYVRFPAGGGSYIDTKSDQSDDETLFTIARAVNDANTAVVYSNRGADRAANTTVDTVGATLAFTGNTAGDSLVNINFTSYGYTDPALNGVSLSTSLSNRPLAEFRLFECEHNQAGASRSVTLRDHTNNTSSTKSVSNTVDRAAAGFGYLIGSSYSPSYNSGTITQPVDVAMFVRYSRVLTSDERVAVVARLKQLAAAYGITV
jgi:hypothetical protein